jgi:PAS domain S-box-containing protein
MSKLKITPTNKERVMREDDLIVSKTDLKGRITYGNKTFIEFSGLDESELIGVQHNVIRHPDMPRAVFHMLWSSIKDGNEIFAYVKNLCSDGSFYWVLANITPSVDANGAVLGYYSVRRKANPKALVVIDQLYRQMLAEEKRVGTRDAIEASNRLMTSFMKEKGKSYEDLVLSLQAL